VHMTRSISRASRRRCRWQNASLQCLCALFTYTTLVTLPCAHSIGAREGARTVSVESSSPPLIATPPVDPTSGLAVLAGGGCSTRRTSAGTMSRRASTGAPSALSHERTPLSTATRPAKH
jgi:hypothetical protein